MQARRMLQLFDAGLDFFEQRLRNFCAVYNSAIGGRHGEGVDIDFVAGRAVEETTCSREQSRDVLFHLRLNQIAWAW